MINLPDSLRKTCEETIGSKLRSFSPVSGGDINEAGRLETAGGLFFLKTNKYPFGREMLETEALGLEALNASGFFKVPLVLARGTSEGIHFLLMEFIEPGPRSDFFWENFGVALASLHRQEQAFFGLDHDNFIGSLPQPNGSCQDFITFFRERRLNPQLKSALNRGLLDAADLRGFQRLYKQLRNFIPVEKPALIHGDLWSGNFISGPSGKVVLLDPAISWAHREMDLAMSRLFGGFANRFYEAYDATYPTEPELDDRLEIYQLYFLLVHVNLFGRSYAGAVRNILRKFS